MIIKKKLNFPELNVIFDECTYLNNNNGIKYLNFHVVRIISILNEFLYYCFLL